MKFLDVCAGIGGFRLAFEEIGFKCAGTIEINAKSVETYNHNFHDTVEPLSIFDLDEKCVPDHDVLCAGFPCQSFSISGKRQGFSDPRGTIIHEIIRIAKYVKPKYMVLENVKNLISHDKGNTLKTIFKMLTDIGYRPSYTVLNSKNFKVPQSRPRIFIIGIRNDLYKFDFDFPRGCNELLPVSSILDKGDTSIPISKKWNTYIDYYAGRIDENGVGFDLPKTRVTLERHPEGVDLDNCIYQMRSSGIRALDLNKPFPTLAVSISGGGAMIPVYSKERRHLSLLELKRIMGFPDNFIFPVSRTDAIKQLANSVCPPVIKEIGIRLSEY